MPGFARLAPLALGLVLVTSLAALPAQASSAAGPARQSTPAAIVPFTGTAVRTSTQWDREVPKKAAADLTRNQETETFAVRDATHWRVDVHVTSPVLDSADQTFVSDGQQVVEYSNLSNRAYRFPTGVTNDVLLLSGLLQLGVPLGTTTDQYINLLKQQPRVTVRALGQDQVAGRQADVIETAPVVWVGTGSCTGPKACAKNEKGYGSSKLWLDHQYGIPLRYETHGLSKVPGPMHGYRYLVTSIAFGQGPSDTDLAYTPPVPVTDVPRSSGGYGGGGGPGTSFQAPPGLLVIQPPKVGGTPLILQSSNYSTGSPGDDTSTAEGVFRGNANQGFVYVKERMRALGLPSPLMTGSPQPAGSCQAWTGTFPDGLRWLAMARGHIAVLVVANKLSSADLVLFAASGICKAPIVPSPSAAEVENTALDRLSTETDITRQILGWVIAAAPNAADKQTLKGFDKRLEAFDRTVFTIRHRGDPQATYSPPGFPPPDKTTFADGIEALKGEMGAAHYALSYAESAVQSAADRQTLVTQGKVFDDLINAVNAMEQG